MVDVHIDSNRVYSKFVETVLLTLTMLYLPLVLTLATGLTLYSTEKGVWVNWGEWQPCSVSCGEGLNERRRECHSASGQNNNAVQCIGKSVEHMPCGANITCPGNYCYKSLLTEPTSVPSNCCYKIKLNN